jgi:hypothetical protein
MSKHELPEDVGYGKPPKSGKFVKGKSGNPNGRPKGSRNLATIVQREAREIVHIKDGGRIKKKTKLEVVLKQLGNKAAQGDHRSQREFLQQVRASEEAINSGMPPTTSREKDVKVLENLLRATSTKPEPEKEKS